MAFIAFYASLVTDEVNLTGSASQIQDSPDAPDGDWMLATDPSDNSSFTLEYDPDTFPAEAMVAGSDWRFAVFVRNTRDEGLSATWDGTVHVNGASQAFTNIEVPDSANPNDGGVLQESIQGNPGGVPLVSLSIDIEVSRSGGNPNARTSLDWDAIEIILEFAEVFDFSGGGTGRALGTATMDIAPEELGTAEGIGTGQGEATLGLIPPRELAGTALGLGEGNGALTLVPPVDLSADAIGRGAAIGNMDQLPYDFPPAAGLGTGRGNGRFDPIAPLPLFALEIIDPVSPGPVFGLYEIIAREADTSIPFVRVAINPAGEFDPIGYPATPITPEGDHSYLWSTSPYVGTFVDIEATTVFQGASSGQGLTGFQVTGGWGVEELASNAPVNVEVTAGAFIEMQGGGQAFGTGAATADLVPPIELAGDGLGLGQGDAGSFTYDLTAASSGIGTGEGLMQTIYTLSGAGEGVGTGSAIPDVIHDIEAAGIGVGTGNATMEVLLRMSGIGIGQGLSTGIMGIDITMAGDGLGTGTGIGQFDVDGEEPDMQGRGDGIGTGLAALDIFDLRMNGRGQGNGTGEGTMDVGSIFEALGIGVGTGTGTMVAGVTELEGAGLGVGSGVATLTLTSIDFSAAGIGIGTGIARWSTGNWPGAGVGVPGGPSDAEVEGGPADAEIQGGAADAIPKGESTDADVDDGTATVEIPGHTAFVKGP